MEKNFEFSFLAGEDRERLLPQLFEILAANMNEIAPTGDPPEEDLRIWREYLLPALDEPERGLLLIRRNGALIGYFQYSISGTTFLMEEIELKREDWGSGAFRALFRCLAEVLPEEITEAEAYADRANPRSQAVLEHLGLNVIGTNRSGRSLHYAGDCRKMLERYRNTGGEP